MEEDKIREKVLIVKDSDVSQDTSLNLNLGIMGHVDSGKTSLAKALSTIGSTSSNNLSHYFLTNFILHCHSQPISPFHSLLLSVLLK
jgi:hypothetical protein